MRASELLTRRHILELSRVAGLTLASAGLLTSLPARAAADFAVPMDQLMAEGALPDIVEGSKDAPVTIVEYASMTCPHCAHFHAEVFPTLKARYIDTGKVRFILREFPLDALAAAAFMIARCGGAEKRDAIVGLLYAQQKTWAVPDDPAKAMLGVLKQAGFTQESFDACLKDSKLYDAVLKVRATASEKYKVESTPTFFINGKKEPGAIPLEQLDQVLEPFLKAAPEKSAN